jgi:hypothetical protein
MIIRIFHKECKSLIKEYNVSLVVADGLGDKITDGIQFFDVGIRQPSRIKRVLIDSKKAFKKQLN